MVHELTDQCVLGILHYLEIFLDWCILTLPIVVQLIDQRDNKLEDDHRDQIRAGFARLESSANQKVEVAMIGEVKVLVRDCGEQRVSKFLWSVQAATRTAPTGALLWRSESDALQIMPLVF